MLWASSLEEMSGESMYTAGLSLLFGYFFRKWADLGILSPSGLLHNWHDGPESFHGTGTLHPAAVPLGPLPHGRRAHPQPSAAPPTEKADPSLRGPGASRR